MDLLEDYSFKTSMMGDAHVIMFHIILLKGMWVISASLVDPE